MKMKFKKVVSLISSVALAVTCASGAFVFDAGALYLPKNGNVFYTWTTGGVDYEADSLEKYIRYIYPQMYPVATSITLNSDGNDALIDGAALKALKDSNYSEIKVEITKGGYSYTAYLKESGVNNFFDSVDSAAYNNGIDFTLNIGGAGGADNGTLKISQTGSYYGGSVYYVFPSNSTVYGISQFRRMLDNAGVDTSDQIRVYTIDDTATGSQSQTTGSSLGTQEGTTLKLIDGKDANYDLKLTLSGSADSGISAYYYTAYDKSSLDLYKDTEIEPLIREKILDAIGVTVDDDKALSTLMDTYVKKVINDILNPTDNSGAALADKKYVTKEEVDKLIKEYYENTDNLKDLATTLINDTGSKEIIEKEIYNVFGLNISDGAVSAIESDTMPKIVDGILTKLLNVGVSYSDYKRMISYYLSTDSENALKELRDALEELVGKENVLNSNEKPYSSLSELLSDLYNYKKQLESAGIPDVDFTTLASQASKASSFLGTETRTLASILGTIDSTYAKKTDIPTDYIDSTKLLGYDYATKSQLATAVKTLNDELTRLKTELNNLKANPFYGTWNSDSFVNAVANEVINRLGRNYSGTSGESAYEIAVRNGFKGTEKAWLNSLVGDSAYDIAVENGFKGSEVAWLNSLRGEDGRDGRDGRDGKDGRDGDDGRVVYVYGNQPNSAAPNYSSEREDSEEPDPDATAAYINNSGNNNYYGTTGNKNSSNVAAANTSRPANPATGVAAGIIIPAAAAASLILSKKDKRRRGRK